MACRDFLAELEPEQHRLKPREKTARKAGTHCQIVANWNAAGGYCASSWLLKMVGQHSFEGSETRKRIMVPNLGEEQPS